MKVKHPSQCSHEALVKFAEKIQEELFLGADREGDPCWDIDKPTDAEDIQQFVLDRLNELGLYPEEI
jgi:hypothetical protein